MIKSQNDGLMLKMSVGDGYLSDNDLEQDYGVASILLPPPPTLGPSSTIRTSAVDGSARRSRGRTAAQRRSREEMGSVGTRVDERETRYERVLCTGAIPTLSAVHAARVHSLEFCRVHHIEKTPETQKEVGARFPRLLKYDK
jgi:hypothetical protein